MHFRHSLQAFLTERLHCVQLTKSANRMGAESFDRLKDHDPESLPPGKIFSLSEPRTRN